MTDLRPVSIGELLVDQQLYSSLDGLCVRMPAGVPVDQNSRFDSLSLFPAAAPTAWALGNGTNTSPALPDGHEAQQSPAGVVDLSLAALDVAPLLARLKVLPPAAVAHLLLQQEAAGLLHLRTGVSRGVGVGGGGAKVWSLL